MSALLVLFKTNCNENIFDGFVSMLDSDSFIEVDEKNLHLCTGSPKFVLCKVKKLKQIKAENILIICTDGSMKLPKLECTGSVTVILSSNCTLECTNLPMERCQFITYGFSNKDTVTISSVSDESAVISFQRRFKTHSGRMIEPMELLVNTDNITKDELLPTITALLYCDQARDCFSV